MVGVVVENVGNHIKESVDQWVEVVTGATRQVMLVDISLMDCLNCFYCNQTSHVTPLNRNGGNVQGRGRHVYYYNNCIIVTKATQPLH